MLTIEQLLQPRYRVVADYPDSKFKVGDIIEFTEEKPYTALNASSSFLVYYEKELKKHPHLFRRAHWSEGRTKDEFPEYVAFLPKYGREEIEKVAELITNEAGMVERIKVGSDSWSFNCGVYHRPATQEEYEAYKNKQS